MKRREFVTSTVLGGTALTVGGLSSCVTPVREKENKTVNPADFELNEITVNSLQAKMASGEMTSAGICRLYLQRIAAIDPLLKALIELNPDALPIAERLDRERKEGKVRGPLHGI